MAQYAAAFKGLQGAATLPKMWDLIAKIFNKIDILIFHGQLRNRVRLRWGDMPGSDERIAAFTLKDDAHPEIRIEIVLNCKKDYTVRPRNVVMGILVHKMLHAYFLVRCGIATEPPIGPDIRGHGMVWKRAAYDIEQMTGLWVIPTWVPPSSQPVVALGQDIQDRTLVGCDEEVENEVAWPAFPDLGTPLHPPGVLCTGLDAGVDASVFSGGSQVLWRVGWA